VLLSTSLTTVLPFIVVIEGEQIVSTNSNHDAMLVPSQELQLPCLRKQIKVFGDSLTVKSRSPSQLAERCGYAATRDGYDFEQVASLAGATVRLGQQVQKDLP